MTAAASSAVTDSRNAPDVPVASIAAMADVLLDPGLPPPADWRCWNGSDPARRLAVYRNNVVVSLVTALGDSFPACRRLAGPAVFDAIARTHVGLCPPRGPVLTEYGAGFADWLDAEVPPEWLPSPALPDLARLEHARLRAWHAADAEPLTSAQLAARLADPSSLPAARLRLHPAATLLRSAHPVVTLWHQHASAHGPAEAQVLDAETGPQSALVLRDADDEVLVLPLDPASAEFVAALLADLSLAEAVSQATSTSPSGAFDPVASLAGLIRHGALVGWAAPSPTATAPIPAEGTPP